ncbi:MULTISPECIES: hypothetical protein [unclassified Rhodococcus (in: high G+C Gram-positive bacteria)]|uniref:hypothetical protein n=1 Tax=unclassified Rhodococcus (in: high G+C Gram-positive bacteria) TaxID=192944 RepID=UPI003397E1E4
MSRLVLSDTTGSSWDSGLAPAVAEVAVEIAPGVDVVVDAADTSTLLSWRVLRDSNAQAFSDAVAEPDVAQIVESARTGSETECDTLHLVPTWIRRARTSAIARWELSPIDEGALMLDEAGARYRTGDHDGAARLVAAASPALEMLTEDCENGETCSSATSELALLAAFAREVTIGEDWGYAIAALSGRIDTIAAIDTVDDELLIRWLEDLVEAQAFDLVGIDLAGGDSTARSEVQRAFVDPHLVPPRILEWRGARVPELRAEFDTGARPPRLVLTVPLASGVDPQCAEASRLIGFAADSSGKLLATTPMVPTGTILTGSFSIKEAEFETATFGIFDSTGDPRDLRLGRLAPALIDADRNMIEAWGLGRSATAALHTVDASADEEATAAAQSVADGFTADALDAADCAVAALERVRTSSGVESTPLLALVAARIDAIRAFIERIESHTPELGAQPLLTELLRAPQFDDSDLDVRR